MSAIAVAVVGGALIASSGSQSAADTQASAANNATNQQVAMYNQARSDLAPYTNTGYQANARLADLLGISGNAWAQGYGSLVQPFNSQTFQQYLDPAYQWQLQQGNQALMNSQAAGNGVLSGASLKDLIAYNQGMANTAYNNAFNQYQTQTGNIYQRLSGVVGTGQAAAAGQAANAMTTGANIGANTLAAGNAMAAGQIGSANAINSGLNNLGGYYMWNNMNSGGTGGNAALGIGGNNASGYGAI